MKKFSKLMLVGLMIPALAGVSTARAGTIATVCGTALGAVGVYSGVITGLCGFGYWQSKSSRLTRSLMELSQHCTQQPEEWDKQVIEAVDKALDELAKGDPELVGKVIADADTRTCAAKTIFYLLQEEQRCTEEMTGVIVDLADLCADQGVMSMVLWRLDLFVSTIRYGDRTILFLGGAIAIQICAVSLLGSYLCFHPENVQLAFHRLVDPFHRL